MLTLTGGSWHSPPASTRHTERRPALHAAQGTAAFAAIDLQGGDRDPQQVAAPPVLAATFSDASSVITVDATALRRTDSERLGIQVSGFTPLPTSPPYK